MFRITGQTGHTYEILATADLSNWSVVGTVALARKDAVNFIEANASDHLSRFYRLLEIPDTPPRLQVLILPNKQVVLRVAGQIGHSYEILATTDLSTWNTVGTVTLATSDSVNLIDTNAAGQSSRFYRVREIPETPPRLQVHIPPKKQVVLQINGHVGHTYEILATANLTNWRVIGIVTLAGSDAVRFIDSNASDYSSRFYRVREVP